MPTDDILRLKGGMAACTKQCKSGQPCSKPNDIEDCGSKCTPKDGSHIYDVVIIGGGAVGTSIARELSKTTLSVLLLEKSSDVSQGASKSNSGIIHGGYDDKNGSVKAKVSHRGNRLFKELNDELHFGFRNIGSLVLAFSKSELVLLEKLRLNGIENGVEGLKILTPAQVIEKEPHINPKVAGALYCHWTGIASPYEYVIALAENAIENGVAIHLNHEVTDILRVSDSSAFDSRSKNGTHFLVRTNRDADTFRGRTVINAAGNMADRVAAMVGANDFTITPRKGEYVILNKSQGHFANHVLFQVPTFHGNLLLGPTSRGAGESFTQRQILQLIIGSAKKTIPGFDATQAITSYTGLRSTCSRGDFIIEETSVPGFVNVAGIDSPGLTSSPAVAQMVREIIGTSLKKNYGLQIQINTSFNPNRKPIIIKKDADFTGRIDDENPDLNIICRCERVAESEILDSMRRPLGAKDTDAVKRRTRAGMGQCITI
jgi:glycerol-3-phosphate dehydrogenase